MSTILLRFPGRRYHATPWGHHVNEGLIEWPPSPWRLLRALLATGYTKLRWPAGGPPPEARSLIEKLASVLPNYRLPMAVGTHSRHYMPLARLKNGREETTLVFDTWAQVDDRPLAVHWDVSLASQELMTFSALARELGYLGRSESWVDGDVVVDDPDGHTFDVRPGGARDRPGADWEQVPLLAPTSPEEYASWRAAAVAAARLQTGVAAGQKKHTKTEKRKLDAVEESYPPDLISCLQVETRWLHQLGWSQPPGSRKVYYWRRRDALETAAPRARQSERVAPVEAMLLAMASASGNTHALPSVTRVVPQAELLHRAWVALALRTTGHSEVLSGRDSARRPLQESQPHRHAHLLHLDLDGDEHLDHVLIWAPMGLDADAQAAVRAVRRTFTKGGALPLRLAIVASGSLANLHLLPHPLRDGVLALLGGPTNASSTWRSLTPFVPPRFMKARGKNTLVGQVTAELTTRGLPAPVSVAVLDPHADEQARLSRHFVRKRRFGPEPPLDCGFLLELVFSEPVAGPLVLGYGCHFGLGVFFSTGGTPLEAPSRTLDT